MSQLQVYSTNLSLYYLFSYKTIIAIKVIFIGFILLCLLRKMQKQINIYIDNINLLECKLKEINKKYDMLHIEITENNTITNELTSKITDCIENIYVLEIDSWKYFA